MAQNYVMIDGKRINLSRETTDNLKKALNIREPEQVKIYCFRAKRITSGNNGYPYNLGCVNSASTRWDGRTMNNDKGHIAVYTTDEVEKIIAGLEMLLDS